MNEIKTMLSVAIEKKLTVNDSSDKHYSIDQAKTAIINYVTKDAEAITESNRYELYYFLLGKAEIIAQGWKLNYAKHIKDPFKTADTINAYIKNTYGV